jgi:hypothetical protein
MDRFSVTLGLLGLVNARDRDLAMRLQGDEERLGYQIPDELRRYYATSGLVDRIEGWFGNRFEQPGRLGLHPDLLPGDHPGLVLITENQALCDWVVALESGEDPPVYVVGNLVDGHSVMEWAPSVSAFMSAIAWDVALVPGPEDVPMIQAQAAQLEPATLDWLRNEFIEGVETRGWPCTTTQRFRRGRQAIELWNCPGQCEWTIVAQSLQQLEELVTDLMGISNLNATMWSDEPEGEALLERIRSVRR